MIHKTKLFREARVNIMFFCKFLATLLLLLLAFCCRTTMAQPSISVSPSPSPSPARAPPVPEVPPEEVKAVKDLLQLSRSVVPDTKLDFSPTDCDSGRFGTKVECNCTSTVCSVTKIDLSDKILTGRIPETIGNLSQLKYLDLSGNKLKGLIPPSFANLSQLERLYLENNNLEGPLPAFLSEMKSLRSLWLHGNLFNESIPREFGIFPSLQYLYLRQNLLSGRIPIELGNISSLTTLYLDDNLLSEQLPPDLGNLSNLEVMNLANNKFSGPLPSSFGKLKNMSYFNIQGNSISGTIPDFICTWQRLRHLRLLGNNFEGPLPTNISALRMLTYLATNNLAGSPDGFLFPNISNANSNLETLILRNCSLSDRIPDYIWKLPALNYLDLSFNNLTGGIPAVVKRPFPKYIFLRRNKLNGYLPGWMLNMTNSFVDVSENLFSNTTISANFSSNSTNLFQCCSNISDWDKKWQQVDYYCANKSLRYTHLYINCGGNKTSVNGSHYEADLNPNGGSTFFLSNNSAWAYSSMGTFMSACGCNKYMAEEKCIQVDDASLYITARVSPISLKYYGFCLEDDKYIVRLHFAEIGWDSTKVRDSDTKRRRMFDVEIQGQKVLTDFNIEEEAGGVHKSVTKEFNISINNSRLEIHLFWSGKGSIMSPSTYYGPLISAISVSPVPKRQRKLSPLIVSGIVGSVLLFVLVILGFFWKLGWLGGKRPKGTLVELFPGGLFNFQQIKAATNNFASENKIGQGGFGAVYKGEIPNGPKIAVKQLSRKSRQGVSEYITEMGTIYSLRHPNLVRLMGCCAEEDELLLVYEYMENKSLGDALFDPGVKAKLDWKKRVEICLDVAKGLAYLHEECKHMKLIHGDIKPTNILLDKDFNAKISDFGFAQPVEKETTRKNVCPDEGTTTPVNTRVKGTQGYIAPERMQPNKDSPKADVYSFGILTLEIISGKRSSTPNPKGQTEYLLERAYRCVGQGNPLDLLDPSLGSDYRNKEAKNIIYLAMQCVNHDPDQRPTMSEVVKILEGKKKIENIFVPVAVDDLMMGKGPVAFSQPIHSATASLEGTSDSATSLSISKEIDESSLSAYYSGQTPEN